MPGGIRKPTAASSGENCRTGNGRWRRAGLPLALCVLLATASCAGGSHLDVTPGPRSRTFTTTATLRGQPFELHLTAPPQPRAPDVLVLYASGDGGWFGAAVDMFKAVGDAGFYAVGISSRTLMHRKGPGGQPLTVADLADDYRVVIDRATEVLGLPPSRRVVLTGWSRGASLAVLTGGTRHAPANLAGVVAIGLAADENLGVASDTDDDPDGTPLARSESSLDMYALIAEVAPRPTAVIQSTGDRYLRASRARELFGADTNLRRFYEVAAKNHRFGGGAAAFAEALRSSLDWIVGPSPVETR
jgi:hypothetical protein